MKLSSNTIGWLNVTPLLAVLIPFFIVPILVVSVASIMQTDGYGGMFMDPTLANYVDVARSSLTYRLYFETMKFSLLTLFFSAIIGFWVAYFLVFHVRSKLIAMGLFLVCTVPFWTSNIIRMISWVPFLGRNGIANQALMSMGMIDEPLEWLLFSDFAVVLAFVHLYTLFMVVPIFNTMMRIDKSLLEAARDAGATGFQTLTNVILPLTKPGIMIGSIFVVTLVMGDFITVRFMSGSQSANVGRLISNDVALLRYPSAAATSVVLLITVLIVIGIMLRFVNIRKEL